MRGQSLGVGGEGEAQLRDDHHRLIALVHDVAEGDFHLVVTQGGPGDQGGRIGCSVAQRGVGELIDGLLDVRAEEVGFGPVVGEFGGVGECFGKRFCGGEDRFFVDGEELLRFRAFGAFQRLGEDAYGLCGGGLEDGLDGAGGVFDDVGRAGGEVGGESESEGVGEGFIELNLLDAELVKDVGLAGEVLVFEFVKQGA